MPRKHSFHSNFSVVETEDTITIGVRSWSDNFRDRISYNRDKILTRSINLWRSNPIAKRIIEITTEFTVGNGFSFSTQDKPSSTFLNAFWKHPLNNLDSQLPEWADEAWRTGDLLVRLNEKWASFCTFLYRSGDSLDQKCHRCK